MDDYDYVPDARILLITLYLCLVAYVYMPPPPPPSLPEEEGMPRTRPRRVSSHAARGAGMFYPEVAARSSIPQPQ